MRPAGLAPVTAAMCVLNLTGFLFVEDSGTPAAFGLILVGFIISLSYVVLWYFWQGRNWARWLVLLASGVALLNMFLLVTVPMVQRVVLIVEAAVGAFLLYWLNTSVVRVFFVREGIDRVASQVESGK
jgi:hypothetical protein